MRYLQALTLSAFLVTTMAWGQKEVTLPKDLPSYGPETPIKAPAVNDSKLR